jgi:hypothetical protein
MSTVWIPQWTTQVKIESGGRYPLGLNRFHDGLEEILIKGIVVAADRLRYITYCCWCIGDIEHTENCNDYSEFVDAFTRRENALALGLYLMEPNYPVRGSTAISKIINVNDKIYDCTFRLMQSNDLGAFGLYYKGTIYNWGLTETDEKGVIKLTESGKELYKITQKYYERTKPDYYTKFKGLKKVPTKALLEWARVNDFDNIRKPEHKVEREFYKSLIFRLGINNPSDYRKDTFAFFLECIDCCCKSDALFNEDLLRNIHYYCSYFDRNGKKCDFKVPNYFDDVHFYWSIYEGHVYFRWWLSKYFEVFLSHLKSCNNGSTIEKFFEEIDQEKFNSVFSFFSGKSNDFYNASIQSIFDLYNGNPKLTDPISEEYITLDKDFNSISGILAKFLLVISCLYQKFKKVRADKRYQFLAANLGTDLWFDVIFNFSTFGQIRTLDLLKLVLKKFIIHQHDLIMIEKNDLRRCWFTTENKNYFHQADTSLIWRPAKYQTIMNFLYDMNLVDQSENKIRFSEEGEKFFKNLMQKYYLV